MDGGNEDILELLHRRFGLVLDDEEITFLTLQGHLTKIEEAPPGSRKRATALGRAAKTVVDMRRARGKPIGERPEEAGPMTDDDGERRFALSRLLALEARDDPGVVDFRARHLGPGTLLDWEKIEEWISERARAQGDPSQYVEIVLPAGVTLRPTLEGLVAESSVPLSELRIEDGVRARFLKYGVPGGKYVKATAVTSGSVLDQLRRLTEKLAHDYSWKEDQATVFVLTGITPLMVGVRQETDVQTEHPAASRVTLVIDPVVSPQEVMESYSSLRQKVLEGTYRPLTEKHLKLAVFAAEKRPSAKWAEVMAAWNEVYPDYGYAEETIFARDCTAAQNRLLNPRLNPDALL
jgi:hypothetical protein